MRLKLIQHTEIATQANGDLVVQLNSYERQNLQIAGIVGNEKGDLTTGNFRYKTAHEKQETSRILNLGQDGIQNMVNDRTYGNRDEYRNLFKFPSNGSSTSGRLSTHAQTTSGRDRKI